MRTQPKFPLPQPVPTTPIRGAGIARVDFHSVALRRFARRQRIKLNSLHAVIKPKRNSVGLLWRGRVFWWSVKGYYRNGMAGGDRRPFHHILWEHYNRRSIPRRHEVFFRDRDYHNFTKANLELLSKEACHRRLHELGESTGGCSDELRRRMVLTRWSRYDERVGRALVDSFNTGGSTVGKLARKQ
ncbi:MAG TPA: HNH endonuclease [Verrucomicrobiota bacterium]|nr:HNH endonuclease [Verrucomicrobiota bacterium]